MANIFGDDNFDDIYGGAGKRIGAILARQDKTRGQNRDRELIANALVAVLGSKKSAMQEETNDTISQLKDQYSLILKGVENDYKNARNNQLRTDLVSFNGPDRDSFINNKVARNYENSDLQNHLGGLSWDQLKQSKDPYVREKLNAWKAGETESIINYYTEAQKNPYIAEPLHKIQQLHMDELVAKVNEIKDDPTKKSLFYGAINKIFPGFGADKQAELKLAVQEAEAKTANLNTRRETANKALVDLVNNKLNAKQRKNTKGESFYISNIFDAEDFKNIDLYKKGFAENFEPLFKEDTFSLPIINEQLNVNTESLRSVQPFKNIDKMVVLENTDGDWVVDENAEPLNVLADAVSKQMAMEKKIGDSAGLVRTEEELREAAMQTLVKEGNLAVQEGFWGSTFYFRKPMDLNRHVAYKYNISEDELSNSSNALETEYSNAVTDQERKSDKPVLNQLVDEEISKQIRLVKDQLDKTTDAEVQEDLNIELDRLTSILKQGNPKLRDQEIIKMMINPPENLKGVTAVRIVGNRMEKMTPLGSYSDAQIKEMITKFTDAYGESEELNAVLSGLNKKDVETPTVATQDVYEKFSPMQRNQYDALSKQLVTVDEELKDTENLSQRDLLVLTRRKTVTENAIRKLIESPGLAGIPLRDREEKKITDDLNAIKNQLKFRRSVLSPAEIKELEEKQIDLEEQLQSLTITG